MLVTCLGGDEAAPVYLLRLWGHCQNRKQWRFENLPPEALQALCRFPGDSGWLEEALSKCRFIRREGTVLVVCNWEEYNRSLIAAWTNGGKRKKPVDDPAVSDGLATGDQILLREDKSRKEKNRREKKKKKFSAAKPQKEHPSKTPLDCDTGFDSGLSDSPTRTDSSDTVSNSSRTPRARDELFDAVAKVTGSDSKASGSYIGRVCKALRKADPPYTPGEVLRLPDAIRARGLDFTLTLGALEKYIGWVRAELPARSSSPVQQQRPLTDDEMAHGTYTGAGFIKNSRTCRSPSCQRADCVSARERGEP